MNHKNDIMQWRAELAGKSPVEVLLWAGKTFSGQISFASSLGLEDQILTEIIAVHNLAIPIFTLDTGRLFAQTYELLEKTEERYGVKINVFFPDRTQVEQLVQQNGINCFRKSIALRKECCRIRKVAPLERALAGKQAWITGMRREQSITREDLPVIEWDSSNGLVKINPLASWSEEEVLAYISAKHIPYNPLHDEGFPTIGCSCCTRAVKPGEDIRAGRWWWEEPEHKECGLHWDKEKGKT